MKKPNKQLSPKTRQQAIKEWEELQDILDSKQCPRTIINNYNKKWSGIAKILTHAGKVTQLIYK